MTIKALYINCSLKGSSEQSHTQLLIERSAHILRSHDVEVTTIFARDYNIGFGMVKNAGEEDQWPDIQTMINNSDIVVIGSPIWLGVKSSVATLVIERMYAYSSEKNDRGQLHNYGKVAGVLVTGNEDGAKAVAMDMLYAMQHIGFTIPPQADAAWLGEVGPGASYGDITFKEELVNKDSTPAGFKSDFTNKNTTIMSYNLMHMATLLSGGIPAEGNGSKIWKEVVNATDATIEGLQ